MEKISIVVPVYNTEKYLEKCLSSIKDQTYGNFEVIIINDGSTDNCQHIIDQFVQNDNRFKCFYKSNSGLSDTRNYALKYVEGNYLLFIDSDDYIEKDMLMQIVITLNDAKVDLIRFGCKVVNEKNETLSIFSPKKSLNSKVEKEITTIVSEKFVEPACFYCYNLKFYNNNNFKFNSGKFHEDLGLIPYILYKANTISSIDYYGYNYVQRKNSITKTSDYKKKLQQCSDVLEQYFVFFNQINKKQNFKAKVLLTYYTECTICMASRLKGKDKNNYIKTIIDKRIIKNIYPYNFKKIIKKIVAKISISLYLKIFN